MKEISKKRAPRWLFIANLLIVLAVLGGVYGYLFSNLDRSTHRELRTTLTCPQCKGEITVWDQVTSSKPHTMDCPLCDAHLFMKFRHFVPLLVIFMASFFATTLFIVLTVLQRAWLWTAYIFILCLVYYVILEVGWCLMLFNYAEVHTVPR